MSQSDTSCYCGSSKSYAKCCQPYHLGDVYPATPEALMRSRYSAYYLANIDYIQETMSGKASEGFDPVSAAAWAKRLIWIGLKVVHSEMRSSDKGQVEFIAQFVDGKQLQDIHELSDFSLQEGRWYYVDGTRCSTKSSEVISRNTSCPCGSQKKWKQCHGKYRI
ncbi:MAG: YchJ family protein [Gammaproteobacteria bacterium]|nr:YchJ family protein [Gammaproteobacteria bacterium]